MHCGRADLCDRPKCGRLGCAISKCGGLRTRSPPTFKESKRQNKPFPAPAFPRRAAARRAPPWSPVGRASARRRCARLPTSAGTVCVRDRRERDRFSATTGRHREDRNQPRYPPIPGPAAAASRATRDDCSARCRRHLVPPSLLDARRRPGDTERTETSPVIRPSLGLPQQPAGRRGTTAPPAAADI